MGRDMGLENLIQEPQWQSEKKTDKIRIPQVDAKQIKHMIGPHWLLVHWE